MASGEISPTWFLDISEAQLKPQILGEMKDQ